MDQMWGGQEIWSHAATLIRQSVSLNGRIRTFFLCHIAAIALHFQCLPTDMDQDQLEDYVFMLQSKENCIPSESYFKFTVFGLRCLFKIEGMEHEHIVLPSISGKGHEHRFSHQVYGMPWREMAVTSCPFSC
jgi:hypothetical protein